MDLNNVDICEAAGHKSSHIHFAATGSVVFIHCSNCESMQPNNSKSSLIFSYINYKLIA